MTLSINHSPIVKCYADSLFMAAKEEFSGKKDFDEFCKKVLELKEVADSEAFVRLSNMPLLKAESFRQIVVDLSSNFQFGKLLENLLIVVKRNNRIKLLSLILDKFIEMVALSNDEVFADLIIAKNIDDKSYDLIKKNLEEILHKKINLTIRIDEEVLGGFIIKTDSKIFDASVSSQLKKIKKKLQKRKVN